MAGITEASGILSRWPKASWPRSLREARGKLRAFWEGRGQDAAMVPACIPVYPRYIPVHHRSIFQIGSVVPLPQAPFFR